MEITYTNCTKMILKHTIFIFLCHYTFILISICSVYKIVMSHLWSPSDISFHEAVGAQLHSRRTEHHMFQHTHAGKRTASPCEKKNRWRV